MNAFLGDGEKRKYRPFARYQRSIEYEFCLTNPGRSLLREPELEEDGEERRIRSHLSLHFPDRLFFFLKNL